MKFVLFADDTNIMCAGEDLQQLLKEMTHEMNKLKNWFDLNKLSLNLDKTKLMLFGRRKVDIPGFLFWYNDIFSVVLVQISSFSEHANICLLKE